MANAVSLSALTQRIDVLRAQGAARFDPVGFCYLQRQGERLQQSRHPGPVALQRLAQRLDRFEIRLAECRQQVEQQWNREQQPELDSLYQQQAFHPLLRQLNRPSQPSPLAELLSLLHHQEEPAPRQEDTDPLRVMLKEQEGALLDAEAATPAPDTNGPRELKALSRARAGHQAQRKRRRIEDALTHTPSDAGPLNSHRLVTRAISAIKDLSPAYLDHFVNYVDTLMVLEKTAKKRGG